MLEMFFVVSLLLPPAVVVLAAASLAIGSIRRPDAAAAHLREHHA